MTTATRERISAHRAIDRKSSSDLGGRRVLPNQPPINPLVPPLRDSEGDDQASEYPKHKFGSVLATRHVGRAGEQDR